MSSDPILSVEDLRVSYGRVEAVRGVSFAVERGSLVTLVGANGAGKSSVINAVSGLLRPAGGRITFQGRDVTRTPAHKLVGRGLVQVPEGRQILATLTIEENLRMGAWHTGGTAQRSIDAVYDRFPVLAERRALPAGALSGGEQQMLAIARALVTNPRLLILDEATEGLAPLVREEIWRALAQLRSAGHAMVVIDKYVHRLVAIADRNVIVEKGRIAWRGTSAELARDPAVWQRLLGV